MYNIIGEIFPFSLPIIRRNIIFFFLLFRLHITINYFIRNIPMCIPTPRSATQLHHSEGGMD